ncbi:N/A [soil metagenome]
MPKAVALVEAGASMSYAELDLQSGRLARLLRRRGIGPGNLVALHTGRSTAALVGILATVKAGAAYVPLDPTAPRSYLEWIVGDCRADLVLFGADRDFPWCIPALALDDALIAAEAESIEPIEDCAGPGDLAYIMSTSGSTGWPTGVRVPHRAVVRLVTGQSYAHFGPDTVFLMNAPLAFDASTFEIWGALLHGARGVVVSDAHPSLQSIADTIRANHVTTAWFTAGLFHALVEHQLEALAGLREILAGGDVLSPTHVLRAQAALPHCHVINGYGPTENTTFTCCYRIPRDGWGGGPVPIGTPIRGTYIRILGEDMRALPDGETGMLYAGGLGLASGYIGNAERSADSFVADPEKPGSMLYCTGDLVRRRPDGNLDFVGRRDRQVKIDGKRVELGEIEESLRRFPGVADAVVTAARGDTGATILTGYIKPALPDGDGAALVSEARAGLARALPSHEIPARIVALDDLPLTASGKIDRTRLPAPPSPVCGPGVAMNETERRLTDIFSRVLATHAIDLDTNFFDLGATSLKLIEAHDALVRIWSGVGVVAVFQHPNIRELARAIEGGQAPVMSAVQTRARQRADALKHLRSVRSAP